ncbi:TetR/AcrR family transcriptional regulator C-terminal domain-containing protein, partial [Nocardia carnea]
ITDPNVVRMKEPLFERWAAAGWKPGAADDALDVVTAFVVGFVIEEQERRQSAATDPTRYSATERDAWLGEGAPLVKEAGHFQDDGDQRFERHLGIVLDGIAARPDA